MEAPRDHRRLSWLSTLSAVLVIAGFLAAKAARDAIFLSRFPVKSLPLFIGISAVVAVPVILLAGKWMMRVGPHRLVPAMYAASAALSLAEYFTIAAFPRVVAVVVFIHLNVAAAVLVSGFWSIVNERFDVHTAKRHIGRIGMGATMGGILGGLLAERTAVYFKPEAILVVLAVLQVLCTMLLWRLGRGAREPQHMPMGSTWSAFGNVVRSSLLRRAGLVVAITAIGAGALDYVFKADIVQHGSKAELLRSLAIFYMVTNIITAVVQVTLCGPLLTALGVPRTVTTLPVTITGFGLLALIFRNPAIATVTRGAELVTRNSLFRAGYELLYAPLPAERKRPTKVALDVGADKIGDILGAQLVGSVVYLVADARTGLLVLALFAGALSVVVALGIPRSYRESLEASLLEQAAELPQPEPAGSEPWASLTSMPSFGHPGEVIPLQFRRRRPRIAPPQPAPTQRVLETIRDLRSNDLRRIREALLASPLPRGAIPFVIELVGGNDEVAKVAIDALRAVAPAMTGTLVDSMLDPTNDIRLRRRLPIVIANGQIELATCGLWRGLADPSFDVRCRSGMALASLAAFGHLANLTDADVFAAVQRELELSPDEWKTCTLTPDPVLDAGEVDDQPPLSHVFRVLGLVLPAEPLRVALQALKTDDAELRGTALEYLESILPPAVHAQVWPLLDGEAVPHQKHADPGRATDLLAKLRASQTHLRIKKRHTAS